MTTTLIAVAVVLAWLGSLAWVLCELWRRSGMGWGGALPRTPPRGRVPSDSPSMGAPVLLASRTAPVGPGEYAAGMVFANETATADNGGAAGQPALPALPAIPGVPAVDRADGGSGGPAASRSPKAFEAAVLSNLESAAGDGWYPVAPFGDHPHPWGLQCLAPDDAAGLVAWANAQGPEWTGVPVYANPAHPQDGPALAWVKAFRVLQNELQCSPEWSPEGHLQIVVNKAFKRVTPSWTCQRRDDGKWHPIDIVHIGLTNVPNIQATRPWVNSEGESGGAAPEPPPGELVPPRPPEQGAPADAAEYNRVAAAPVADASTHVEQDPARAALANAGGGDAAGQPAVPATPGASAGDRILVGVRGSELPRPPEASGLLNRLAASLGLLVLKADETTIENAVDTLADKALRLERELGDARGALAAEREYANAAVVDLYIARRRVDPAKRAAALEICAADRAVALRAWDNGPAVAAAARGPKGASAGTPADPLAGAVFGNAAPATGGGVARPGGAALERIVAAGKRLQAERGLDPSRANDEAWAMYRAGTLETFSNTKEIAK